jgi:hypothetical protein
MEEIYEELRVHTYPKVAGSYRVGKSQILCTKFSIHKKPNFIHRFFMRAILGIYWEDSLNYDENGRDI